MSKYFGFLLLFFLFSSVVTAKNNSCAGHGGVSYCSNYGQYICNDGSNDEFSVCGGMKTHTVPNMDFTLFPPKMMDCPAHAEYSYSASNCVCQEGFTPSREGNRCVLRKVKEGLKIQLPEAPKYRAWEKREARPRNILFRILE